jgi:hypothetical protein
MMNKKTYVITRITEGGKRTLKGTVVAESAEEAARAYIRKRSPRSGWGFERRVKVLDADTRGLEYAEILTDAGIVAASRV